VKGAADKAKEKIKALYGVDIADKGVLQQIVDMAKSGFGGNLDMAIRSPQIRDLIQLYAMTTGQKTTGMPGTQAAAVAGQGAHVAPAEATSNKVATRRRGAPKGQKAAKKAVKGASRAGAKPQTARKKAPKFGAKAGSVPQKHSKKAAFLDLLGRKQGPQDGFGVARVEFLVGVLLGFRGVAWGWDGRASTYPCPTRPMPTKSDCYRICQGMISRDSRGRATREAILRGTTMNTALGYFRRLDTRNEFLSAVSGS
jgi:hypothetical protein